MDSARRHQIRSMIEGTAQRVAGSREHIKRAKAAITNSRKVIERRKMECVDHVGKQCQHRQAEPPDALCACFDAIFEAVRQADKTNDPDLIAVVERAFERVGASIRAASGLLKSANETIH